MLPPSSGWNEVNGGSMDLRNVGIPLHHYTVSQSTKPRLDWVFHVSLNSKDGGSMVLRKVGVLPKHYYTVLQHRTPRLDWVFTFHFTLKMEAAMPSETLVSYCITTRCHNKKDLDLTESSHFTSPWRWRRHGPPKRWYHTASLHGVTTQKTSTWNITAVQASKLEIYHHHLLSQYQTGTYILQPNYMIYADREVH